MLLLATPLLVFASDDFASRLQEYITVRTKAVSGVKLKPTASPDQIAARQRDLAQRIRKAREHAQQGNIFTPAIAEQFRQFLGTTMKGPDAAAIRQSLARSEPVKMQIGVNQEYPAGVPRQTTPPTLLANLPKLPNGFEYRLVGGSLLLLDQEAGLVVDFLPNAIPQ